ncbi:MAG: hypothetical protein GXP55_03320 [Deltaproteobacteria bacterium]|nr:hypothetical protein [Deltaproteobacteria bacterium]
MGAYRTPNHPSSVLRLLLVLLVACALTPLAGASAEDNPGRVELPLAVYQELLHGTSGRAGAPAGYALGRARVNVAVTLDQDSYRATVTVDVPVRVLEARWTLVPLVALGTPLSDVSVGGTQVELIPTPGGMAWATNEPGLETLHLVYQLEARHFGAGRSFQLPLPRTGAQLTATLPATGLDVALIPANTTDIVESGGSTRVTASLPTSAGVQLSWRESGSSGGYTLSRASYHGRLEGDTVQWTAELGVEVEGNGSLRIPVLPSDVALAEVRVDRQLVPISVVEHNFAARVRGRGRHTITLAFAVPRTDHEGLPGVDLRIPRVPVSRFELTLPGMKEVHVTPAAGVELSHARGGTTAVFHVAMTDALTLSWPEAVPEGVSEDVEALANATLYQVAHAEEGVLHLRTVASYEVTRGSLSQLSFSVPEGVQFNEVSAEGGGVSDWRLTDDTTLTVWLDRAISDEFKLTIEYERTLETSTDASEATFSLPLLSAREVHRQRGMVALLASRHLTLEPVSEQNVARVGENQLPASIRDSVDMTVAHTFRYLGADAALTVKVKQRERERGRFDAQVDTLISLSDVTLAGAASVNVNVKSGSLTEMTFRLPAGVNFLGLTAPSLRERRVREQGDHQVVDVEFTQDMQGEFRVDVNYEQISAEGDAELEVPTLHVEGADVEQGRIAVEALAALQVEAGTLERLSPAEISELPQQLVMRTTNPILLAYRYARATPAPALGLRVTRHREIEVQDAIIDEANYRMLYTEDGLVVTTASFTVRNNRQQFLRVALPEGSEVWSATVAGHAETPAMATDAGEHAPAVLVNIINSTEGFPVELTYATPVAKLGLFGRVTGVLPRPDMVVTRTRLQVYLPSGRHYGEPVADMDPTELGVTAPRAAMALEDASAAADGRLRFSVPAEGIRFSFEKLYAGQRSESVEFAIPYVSPAGHTVGVVISLVGTVLAWLGLLGVFVGFFRTPRASLRTLGAFAGACVFGVALLGLSVWYLPIGFGGSVLLSLLLALGAGANLAYRHIPRWVEVLKSKLAPTPAMAGAGAPVDVPAPNTSVEREPAPDAGLPRADVPLDAIDVGALDSSDADDEPKLPGED